MGCAWGVHRACTGRAWVLHGPAWSGEGGGHVGPCTGYAWVVHGACSGCAWVLGPALGMNGVCTGHALGVHRTCISALNTLDSSLVKACMWIIVEFPVNFFFEAK